MNALVEFPVPLFYDTEGDPLDNGYIYIGQENENPKILSKQLAIYWDEAGTIPASQPIRTINGYPARNGTPTRFYVGVATYSIAIYTKRGRLVTYQPSTHDSAEGLREDLANTTDPTKGAGLVGRVVYYNVDNRVGIGPDPEAQIVPTATLLEIQNYTLPSGEGLTLFSAVAQQTTVMSDFVLQTDGLTTSADSGATRAIIRHTGPSYGRPASTAGSLLRASEHHTIRGFDTINNGSFVLEVGLHTEVVGNTLAYNVGIYMTCDDAFLNGAHPALRGDCGLLIGGNKGWYHGITYYDTDSSILFDVDQLGLIYGKDIQIGTKGAFGTVLDFLEGNVDPNVGLYANRSDTSGARTLILGTDYTARYWLDANGSYFGTKTLTPIATRVNGLTVGGGANFGNIESRCAVTHKIGLSTTSGNLMLFFTDNGAAAVGCGSIAVSGSSTTFNTSSDERIKQNIVNATYDADWINQIQIREFEFIAEPGNAHTGVIAQELAAVESKAVNPSSGTFGEEDFFPAGVDYTKLIPKLLLEVQHLRARVAQLEAP